MSCDRCGKPTNMVSVSYFNTDQCCLSCLKHEQQHPDYGIAKAAELAAVKRGDLNFPGVGLPAGFTNRSTA